MTVIFIIASLLAVLCIHLSIANAYGMTGMEAFKYIISEPLLIKMIGLCYCIYFAFAYFLLYWIYQFTL